MYGSIHGFVSKFHVLKSILPEIVKNAIEERKGMDYGQVTTTFFMDRIKEVFDNATGKWDMTIRTAAEQAASSWGFICVQLIQKQEKKCQ